MCHPGWLVVMISIIIILIIPSSLGAPQGDAGSKDGDQHQGDDALKYLLLKEEALYQKLKNTSSDLTNHIHNIQKRQGFRFDIPDDHLFRAFARIGELDMVQFYVVYKNVSVNSQDIRNMTALIWSSRYGHTEVVEFLLLMGAKVNIQNYHGDTALLWAVGGHQVEIVELLMIHNADPNIPERTGLTPVGVAAAMNHEAELRIMDKYAWLDLNHQDNRGRTALNLAATVGQATMIVILGYWGNIDIPDNNDMTPTMWSMNLKDTATLLACLMLCPDTDLRDDRNNTAMDIAIQVGNTAGEAILRDYLEKPLTGCWLGDEQYPPKNYTFFDCKQIQCMCQENWRHTGVYDPACVEREVKVFAKQEIMKYEHLNETFEFHATANSNKTYDYNKATTPNAEDNNRYKRHKRVVDELSQQEEQKIAHLNENVKYHANEHLKEPKYANIPPSPIASAEQNHQTPQKFVHQ